MFRSSRGETAWRGHVVQHYGSDIASTLQWGAPDNITYHARCKRLAVLRAWIDGKPINEIESTFTINAYRGRIAAGNIRGFADYARFHLSAAFDIADVLLLGEGPSAEDIETLLAQLEIGIPAAALELLDLPVQLDRGSYLALYRAGFVRPSDIWNATEQRIRELLGPATATTIWAARSRRDSSNTP